MHGAVASTRAQGAARRRRAGPAARAEGSGVAVGPARRAPGVTGRIVRGEAALEGAQMGRKRRKRSRIDEEGEGAPAKRSQELSRILAVQLAQGQLDGVGRQHGGAAAPPVEQADRERGKKEPLRGAGAEGLEGRTDELGGEDLGVVPTRESAEPGSPGANVEAAQPAAGERVQRLYDARGAQ
jgi:hypothetical protein